MTKDEALRLALEALEYHTDQTRPIPYTIAAIVEIKAALKANNKSVDFYGYCPICNAKGLSRERHPDGSDVCTNGHIYESKYALTTPPQRKPQSHGSLGLCSGTAPRLPPRPSQPRLHQKRRPCLEAKTHARQRTAPSSRSHPPRRQ